MFRFVGDCDILAKEWPICHETTKGNKIRLGTKEDVDETGRE